MSGQTYQVASRSSSKQNLVQSVADISAQSFGLRRDVRALKKGNNLIGQDLQILDVNLKFLQGRLGERFKVNGQEVPKLSTAMDVIMEKVKALEKTVTGMHTSFNLALADETVRINQIKSEQDTNRKRAAPLFLQFKEVMKSNLRFPLDKLSERLSKLEHKGHTRNDVPKSVMQTVKRSNKTEEDEKGFAMIFDQESGFHTAKESSTDNDLDTASLIDRIQQLENKLNDVLTQSAVVHDI